MIFIFFIIALVYSSAGFGGGSMYISLLSQSTVMGSSALRLHALICNATVTGQGILQWSQSTTLKKNSIRILLCAIFPCSLAVFFPLEDPVFMKLLGTALLLAGSMMLLQEKWQQWQLSITPLFLYICSGLIGGLAGFTGIGGGIYLSPLLHLSRWGNAKEIAQLSSWFILINSMVSITILWTKGNITDGIEWQWVLAVLIGGWLGSRISISWLKVQHIRWITSILLIFAGIRILLR